MWDASWIPSWERPQADPGHTGDMHMGQDWWTLLLKTQHTKKIRNVYETMYKKANCTEHVTMNKLKYQ